MEAESPGEAIVEVRISCRGHPRGGVSFAHEAEEELESFLTGYYGGGVESVELHLRSGHRIILDEEQVGQARRVGLRDALTAMLWRRMEDHRRVDPERAATMRTLEALGMEVKPRPRTRYKASEVEAESDGAWGALWDRFVASMGLPASWQTSYASESLNT